MMHLGILKGLILVWTGSKRAKEERIAYSVSNNFCITFAQAEAMLVCEWKFPFPGV
jgi:hypothetical protein